MTLVRYHGSLTAADLPSMMTDDDDDRSGYRFPLLQLVADWNRATDPATLIVEPPQYNGSDPLLLPAVAAVAHGLAHRTPTPPPAWVLHHQAPTHTMLFAGPFDDPYSRMVRARAPAAICRRHRIWYHHRLLDKGTPDWWLPWWEHDEDDPALDSPGPDTDWPTDPARVDIPPVCCHTDPPQGDGSGIRSALDSAGPGT